MRSLIRISRFLSFVLRHRPESVGLSLDANGWANVDELLEAAERAGVALTDEILRRIVAEDEKTRYSLREDGLRIRANYGHSIPVDLGLSPERPPEFLYHGTATRNLDSIKKHGIVRHRRRYVHLSTDPSTAVKVGGRHGRPAVLTVEAERMYMKGFEFYHSRSGIWLTDRVPGEYILFCRLLLP